jgi:hypothetical protein
MRRTVAPSLWRSGQSDRHSRRAAGLRGAAEEKSLGLGVRDVASLDVSARTRDPQLPDLPSKPLTGRTVATFVRRPRIRGLQLGMTLAQLMQPNDEAAKRDRHKAVPARKIPRRRGGATVRPACAGGCIRRHIVFSG